MIFQKCKYYHVAIAIIERRKRVKFNEHTIKFNKRLIFNRRTNEFNEHL